MPVKNAKFVRDHSITIEVHYGLNHVCCFLLKAVIHLPYGPMLKLQRLPY